MEFVIVLGTKIMEQTLLNQRVHKIEQYLTDQQKKQLKNEFQIYDLNKDGIITANELFSIYKKINKQSTLNQMIEIIKNEIDHDLSTLNNNDDIIKKDYQQLNYADFLCLVAKDMVLKNQDRKREQDAMIGLTNEQIKNIRRQFDLESTKVSDLMINNPTTTTTSISSFKK